MMILEPLSAGLMTMSHLFIKLSQGRPLLAGEVAPGEAAKPQVGEDLPALRDKVANFEFPMNQLRLWVPGSILCSSCMCKCVHGDIVGRKVT